MSNILQSLIQDNKSEKSSKSNKSSTQSPNKVCFKFKNETENFTIDLKKLPDKHLPDDHKIKANEILVTLPDWLIRDHLLDYLNYEEQIGEGIFNVLKCSEYFQNYSYSVNIIKNLILDNIHVDNAIDYLSESYAKLNYSSLNNLSVDTCWFDLFYISLDTVGRNFVYYISEPNLNQRIKSFDKKVIEEILEKFFSYVKGEDDMQLMTQENIELIITFMSEVNNVKNIFDLLTSEYMNICSEESIHDLSTIPNPHLVVKIPKDFENFYNEFNYDLGLNNKQLIFEIYYRKLDDTLHVSLKLKNKTNQSPNDTSSCMNVLTFLSIVKFEPKNNLSKIFKPQVNIKSLTNSKCLHNICVVKKFKMSLNENSVYSAHDVVGHSTNFHNDFGDYFRIHSLSEGGNNFYTVQIYLKLCFLHSIAGSHLITNFQLICKDPNIHKMTRQLFILLLRKFLTQQGYEDCILVAMINWFKDELNINEDLTEILDELRWENVSPVLIFEFVMKFCSKIKTPETKESLMNILQGRTNEENFSQMFMSCLFDASRKLNYTEIFSENKKLKKMNLFNIQDEAVIETSKAQPNSIRNILKTAGKHLFETKIVQIDKETCNKLKLDLNIENKRTRNETEAKKKSALKTKELLIDLNNEIAKEREKSSYSKNVNQGKYFKHSSNLKLQQYDTVTTTGSKTSKNFTHSRVKTVSIAQGKGSTHLDNIDMNKSNGSLNIVTQYKSKGTNMKLTHHKTPSLTLSRMIISNNKPKSRNTTPKRISVITK